MGREIRRVPVGWQHPVKHFKSLGGRGTGYTLRLGFVPLLEGDRYACRLGDWERDAATFDPAEADCTIEEWCGPRPDPADFTPIWTEEEASGWCVYETVSEGTPVTPVFATPEELVDYLCEHGDYWDQRRRLEQVPGSEFYMACDPWDRASAEKFVLGDGWFPSGIVDVGKIYTAANAAEMPK